MKTKHNLEPEECKILEETNNKFDIWLLKIYAKQYEQEQSENQSKLIYEQEQKRITNDLR